jgi:hypothetical protein
MRGLGICEPLYGGKYFHLEGVEVVADDGLEVVHDLVAGSPDTKGLGHLRGLACRRRTNSGLNETVLTFSVSLASGSISIEIPTW